MEVKGWIRDWAMRHAQAMAVRAMQKHAQMHARARRARLLPFPSFLPSHARAPLVATPAAPRAGDRARAV